jgi:pseudouridine kinase
MTVVVVGGVNVDLLARPEGPLRPATSTPGRIAITAGGAGRNVAENLARLGVPTVLIAAAGADALTDDVLARTAAAGVDTRRVRRVAGARNHYVAIADAGGAWAVADMSAAEALNAEDVAAEAGLLSRAAAVVVDANLQPAAIARAATLAPAGRLVLLGVSRAKAPRLRDALGRAALIVAGAPEAEALLGATIREPSEAVRAARALAAPPDGRAIVTLGAQGLAWCEAGEGTWHDALPAAVVDPTGAGDAVAAVAILALVRGWPRQRAAPAALTAAALTLEVEGATHPGLSLDALHVRR